jgi:UDP-glucose 4-epimerase
VKALVTGGAGFIGSHLVDHLLAHGHEVVALDNLSTGVATNLLAATDRPGFKFVRGSILDAPLVNEVVARCDTVFHLAAAVGVHTIVDRPVESLRINLHGTEIVLAAVARHGRRFLFTSTSEIYGKNTADRLGEDDDRILGSALKSRWSYATAKALDELLTHCHWCDAGTPTVIVRPFNIVGPRQTGRYGMVLPNFVDQALAGRPITVYGDGRQRRCFCSVTDMVPTLVALIEQPRGYGQAVNVGGHEEVSIAELADRVRRGVGSASEVVYRPYEEVYGSGYEDMQRRVPDTTRARELVGFSPTVELDELIAMVAESKRDRAVPSRAGGSDLPDELAGGEGRHTRF